MMHLRKVKIYPCRGWISSLEGYIGSVCANLKVNIPQDVRVADMSTSLGRILIFQSRDVYGAGGRGFIEIILGTQSQLVEF